MTVRVTCDWCATPIDDPDVSFSAEELNRMGFEEGLGDHHVVVESRFSGVDRFGHEKKRAVTAHYHEEPCYSRMLTLLHDQRRWAETRGGGPTAATTPRWLAHDPSRDPKLNTTGSMSDDEAWRRRRNAWVATPKSKRQELVLEALADDKLTIGELTSRFNEVQVTYKVYETEIRRVVTNLLDAGAVDRRSEPRGNSKTAIRYRYFRCEQDEGAPMAALEAEGTDGR